MNLQNVLIAVFTLVCVTGFSDNRRSVKIEQNGHEYHISNDVSSPLQITLKNDGFKIITPSLPDNVAIQLCASFDEVALKAIRIGKNIESHECLAPGTGMAMEIADPKTEGVPMYISNGDGHNYYGVERRYKDGKNIIVNINRIEALDGARGEEIYLAFLIDLNRNLVFEANEIFAAQLVLQSTFD